MKYTTHALLAAMALCASASAVASSHREAPSITKTPKVDATDLYMFNSYESGRADYVTIIANYLPLQDAYGGPNYFSLDDDALYEIHIDNNGDAVEDVTFQFDFKQTLNSIEIPSGGPSNVAIPLSNAGDASNPANVQTSESYGVTMVKGDRRSGARTPLGNFNKPFDYIGTKSFADYPGYARGFIQPLNLGTCGAGKVFVGQRAESFAIDLGRVFDLINLNPLGPRDGGTNVLADKNITSIAMEIPKACLVNAAQVDLGNNKRGVDPVIGAWTTASVRQATLVNPSPASGISTTAKKGGAWTQVSRLGMPLVNEVVIGLKDKDKFNASEPKDDVANFKNYVFYPTLPALIQKLYPSAPAPTNFPRQDLVTAFLTGVPTINKPANKALVPADMLRLNTTTPTVVAASQNDLGVIGGDTAGFPNGRRPGDDVTDVSLRVAMGVLCHAGLPPEATCVPADAKAGTAPFTDGVVKSATAFDSVFPYLKTPNAGSR
ncbi:MULTISPECIES: DUF4331 domain-containing protein [unclassified Psychrobacter]|uniref:DUF4331 domain-containing protein n=1 Tax=unclassified Psychrobacter TaxID=196806 RepID=UPI000354E565|nr:DUF4331 domain-containing protein [Psychrobacter sp. G]AGP48835.1 hypothetical protein PSYCG_06570 [Psychrobacter sp. G]